MDRILPRKATVFEFIHTIQGRLNGGLLGNADAREIVAALGR